MHERERHRMILSAVQTRSVATVQDLSALTGASEATVRRDIAALDGSKKLRRVRGGAEALEPGTLSELSEPSFQAKMAIHTAEKRAIAREAAAMCADGDPIILNGGSTTFQMVHHLASARLQVMTNSFSIANHLVEHSRTTVLLPAGAIYRDQSLVLSPFEDDGISHFRARLMFMGAHSVSRYGIGETDPLIVQSEQRLMRQADEVVLLVDASKFRFHSSMIISPLERLSRVITDDRITDADAAMVEAAGAALSVVSARDAERDVSDVA